MVVCGVDVAGAGVVAGADVAVAGAEVEGAVVVLVVGPVVVLIGAVVTGVEGLVDFIGVGEGEGVEVVDDDPLFGLLLPDVEPDGVPPVDVEPLPVLLVGVVPPLDDVGSLPDVVPDVGSLPEVVPEVGSELVVVPDVVPLLVPLVVDVVPVAGDDPEPEPAEEMTTVSSATPKFGHQSRTNERAAIEPPCCVLYFATYRNLGGVERHSPSCWDCPPPTGPQRRPQPAAGKAWRSSVAVLDDRRS